jgi:hypothetical protein
MALAILGGCIIQPSFDAIRDAAWLGVCIASVGISKVAGGIILVGHWLS